MLAQPPLLYSQSLLTLPKQTFPLYAFFTRKNLSAIQHLSQLSGIKMIAAEWFVPQTFQR